MMAKTANGPTFIPLAIATVLGVGYAPFAPGTFGSAAGCVLWWIFQPRPRSGRRDRRAVRRSDRGAAASPSGISGGADPGQVVIDEVMGMLITLFMNPVGWQRALVAFFLFRVCSTSSSPILRTASRSCTAASASWPTTRWRRSTRISRFARSCRAWSGVDLLHWTADHEGLHPRGRQRNADAVPRRHELAVHHRAAEHDRLRRPSEGGRRRRRRRAARV